jgi:plastocyanin
LKIARLRLVALVATVVAVGAVSGCGGSRSSAAVATTHVTMPRSYRFSPDKIVVKAGSSVTWTNFTHSVKLDGQPDRTVRRGETISVRFDKPGTYTYICSYHPHDMRGEVIVK